MPNNEPNHLHHHKIDRQPQHYGYRKQYPPRNIPVRNVARPADEFANPVVEWLLHGAKIKEPRRKDVILYRIRLNS